MSIKEYAEQSEQTKQSIETQSKIAIYKARVDRKCGEWLKDNIKAGNPQLSNGTTIRLNDVNITRDESSRLKKIADIPEEKFEAILQELPEGITQKKNHYFFGRISLLTKYSIEFNANFCKEISFLRQCIFSCFNSSLVIRNVVLTNFSLFIIQIKHKTVTLSTAIFIA